MWAALSLGIFGTFAGSSVFACAGVAEALPWAWLMAQAGPCMALVLGEQPDVDGGDGPRGPQASANCLACWGRSFWMSCFRHALM
jgi:hypothetical protein